MRRRAKIALWAPPARRTGGRTPTSPSRWPRSRSSPRPPVGTRRRSCSPWSRPRTCSRPSRPSPPRWPRLPGTPRSRRKPCRAGELSEALAQISWPDEVAGCVLVQEIVVLPPAAAARPVRRSRRGRRPRPPRIRTAPRRGWSPGCCGTAEVAACLLRLRGDHDDEPAARRRSRAEPARGAAADLRGLTAPRPSAATDGAELAHSSATASAARRGAAVANVSQRRHRVVQRGDLDQLQAVGHWVTASAQLSAGTRKTVAPASRAVISLSSTPPIGPTDAVADRWCRCRR